MDTCTADSIIHLACQSLDGETHRLIAAHLTEYVMRVDGSVCRALGAHAHVSEHGYPIGCPGISGAVDVAAVPNIVHMLAPGMYAAAKKAYTEFANCCAYRHTAPDTHTYRMFAVVKLTLADLLGCND